MSRTTPAAEMQRLPNDVRGVRRGDRVAISVPVAPYPSVRGDEVALAYPGERQIGTALHDAMPGQKVDVLTDDRPDWCCGEHFYVTDRPRHQPKNAAP